MIFLSVILNTILWSKIINYGFSSICVLKKPPYDPTPTDSQAIRYTNMPQLLLKLLNNKTDSVAWRHWKGSLSGNWEQDSIPKSFNIK